MFSSLLFTIFVLSVSVAAWETIPDGYQLELSPEDQDLNDDFYQYLHQHELRRPTRQIQGNTFKNPDESTGFAAKLPIISNDQNKFIGLGGVSFNEHRKLTSATAGFAFDNINGHKLSLTETHIPQFGHQVTAAGQANLIRNQNHNLNANGFITRNIPTVPQVPNFNTFGGGVDYSFKNKIGASLGVTHTPLVQKTDFSANGNWNIFKRKSDSLNFNAGVSRSMSPILGSSPWSPTAGLTYNKWF